MYDDEKLSLDLVWQADGHLTEIALSVLGDGEEALLPADALTHAAACAACSAGLGHAALLSLRTGEALRERAAQAEAPRPAARPAPQPDVAPLPTAAIVAALSLSALGVAPSVIAEAGRVHQTWGDFRHAFMVIVRVARAGCAAAGSGAMPGWITALSWLSAALLVMAGLCVARAMGNRLSLKGGM